MPEPLKYGKWYHVRNEYLVAGTPGFLDSNGPARGCNTNYQDVSISAKKDRVAQGTGVWRIIPASDSAAAKPKNFGEDVMIGDYFYLQNCYGDAGYMEVCGDCGACTSNRYDVSLNKVRHREGAGSKNAIWQFWVGHAGPLNEGEPIHIKSAYSDSNFLDVCGSYSSDIRNDVSTHSSATRLNSLTGTWSVIPYDSSGYDALVDTQEDILPNMIRIERIQCVIPNSGVAGPEALAAVSAIVAETIGATTSAVFFGGLKFGGLKVALAGAATPVADFMVALTTAEASAVGAAVGAAAKAAASKFHLSADQPYIKVNGDQVWPTGTLPSMNVGDILNVNWTSPRRQAPNGFKKGEGATVIQIWDHDATLGDECLFQLDLLPGNDLVNSLIIQTDPDQGSSYILYLTATGARSSRQILRDKHKAAMERIMSGRPN